MKEPVKGPAYEKYMELKKSQEPISNQDFVPFIVDNIFSKEDIEHLYEIVNNTPEDKTQIQKWGGMKAWHIDLGPRIKDKINEAVKRSLGDNVRLVNDHSFARYSMEYGWMTKLFPHTDMRDKQRITFDIQIRADEEWGVVVEDVEYFLEDNQALVFAGTQQPHWRRKKELKSGSHQDMIFCHLEYVEDVPYDDHQDQILHERNRFFSEYYDMHPDPSTFY